MRVRKDFEIRAVPEYDRMLKKIGHDCMTKGSMKWIRRVINCEPEILNSQLKNTGIFSDQEFYWLSPQKTEGYKEHRNQKFLDALEIDLKKRELKEFWPSPGASWDALGARDPDNDKTWYNRGCSLWALGRYDEALESYNKALELNPDSDKAWKNRGNALEALGRNGEALGEFLERAHD